MRVLAIAALIHLGIGAFYLWLHRWGSRYERPGQSQSANRIQVRLSGPGFLAIGAFLSLIWIVRWLVPG